MQWRRRRTCLLQPATTGWGASLIRRNTTAKERLTQLNRLLQRQVLVSRSRTLLQHWSRPTFTTASHHCKLALRCRNARLPAQQNTKAARRFAGQRRTQLDAPYRVCSTSMLFFDLRREEQKLGAGLEAHRFPVWEGQGGLMRTF